MAKSNTKREANWDYLFGGPPVVAPVHQPGVAPPPVQAIPQRGSVGIGRPAQGTVAVQRLSPQQQIAQLQAKTAALPAYQPNPYLNTLGGMLSGGGPADILNAPVATVKVGDGSEILRNLQDKGVGYDIFRDSILDAASREKSNIEKGAGDLLKGGLQGDRPIPVFDTSTDEGRKAKEDYDKQQKEALRVGKEQETVTSKYLEEQRNAAWARFKESIGKGESLGAAKDKAILPLSPAVRQEFATQDIARKERINAGREAQKKREQAASLAGIIGLAPKVLGPLLGGANPTIAAQQFSSAVEKVPNPRLFGITTGSSQPNTTPGGVPTPTGSRSQQGPPRKRQELPVGPVDIASLAPIPGLAGGTSVTKPTAKLLAEAAGSGAQKAAKATFKAGADEFSQAPIQTRSAVRKELEESLGKAPQLKNKGALFNDPNIALERSIPNNTAAYVEQHKDLVNAAAIRAANQAKQKFASELSSRGVSVSNPEEWGALVRYRAGDISGKQLNSLVGAKKAASIRKAESFVGKLLEDYRNRINNRYIELGLPGHVKKLERYLPESGDGHFGKNFESQGGFIDQQPGQYSASFRQRKGKQGTTSTPQDLGRFFESYFNDYYKVGQAVRYEELSGLLKGKSGDRLRGVLQNQAEEFFGQTVGPGANATKKYDSLKKARAAEQKALRVNSMAQIGGSLVSLLPQSSAAAMRAFSNPVLFGKGALDALRGVTPKSSVLTTRYEKNSQIVPTAGRKFADALYSGIRNVERGPNTAVYNSFIREAEKKGLRGKDAEGYANREFKRLIGSRATGDLGSIFRGPATQTFTQFQPEVQSQFNYLTQIAPKSPRKLAGALAGLYAYNQGTEALAGRKVTIDPVSALVEGGQLAAEGKPLQAAGRIGGEALSNVAGGQSLAMLLPEEVREKYFGGTNIGRFGGLPPIAGGIQNTLKGAKGGLDDALWQALLSVVPAGQQIERTTRGIRSVNQEQYLTRSGEGLFPIENTPANMALAAMFGPSATKQSKEAFKDTERGGLFPASKENVEALNTLLDGYQQARRNGAAAGPEIQLSEREKSVAAQIGIWESRGLFSDAEHINEKIEKLSGKRREEAEIVRDKVLLIQSSILKSAAMEALLRDKQSRGEITGEAELWSERGKIAAQRAAEKTRAALSGNDLASFLYMNDYEKEGFLEHLKSVGKQDVAEQYIRGANSLRVQQNYEQGIPVTTIDLIKFEKELANDVGQLGYSPLARDLVSADKSDLIKAAQRDPAIKNQIPEALDLVGMRKQLGGLTDKGASDIIKKLNKIAAGDFSSGGGGGRRGGRKRGGRKGGRKRGGKKTISSVRLGRTPGLPTKPRANAVSALLKPKKSKRTGVLAGLGL